MDVIAGGVALLQPEGRAQSGNEEITLNHGQIVMAVARKFGWTDDVMVELLEIDPEELGVIIKESLVLPTKIKTAVLTNIPKGDFRGQIAFMFSKNNPPTQTKHRWLDLFPNDEMFKGSNGNGVCDGKKNEDKPGGIPAGPIFPPSAKPVNLHVIGRQSGISREEMERIFSLPINKLLGELCLVGEIGADDLPKLVSAVTGESIKPKYFIMCIRGVYNLTELRLKAVIEIFGIKDVWAEMCWESWKSFEPKRKKRTVWRKELKEIPASEQARIFGDEFLKLNRRQLVYELAKAKGITMIILAAAVGFKYQKFLTLLNDKSYPFEQEKVVAMAVRLGLKKECEKELMSRFGYTEDEEARANSYVSGQVEAAGTADFGVKVKPAPAPVGERERTVLKPKKVDFINLRIIGRIAGIWGRALLETQQVIEQELSAAEPEKAASGKAEEGEAEESEQLRASDLSPPTSVVRKFNKLKDAADHEEQSVFDYSIGWLADILEPEADNKIEAPESEDEKDFFRSLFEDYVKPEKGNGSDPLAAILHQIKNIPKMSLEEEIELAERKERGDGQAKKKLMVYLLPLAHRIASKYYGRGIDVLDLMQSATLEFDGVVDRFKPRLGARLAAYAKQRIKGKILDDLRTLTRSRSLTVKAQLLQEKIYYGTGHKPTDEELAEKLDVSFKELERARKNSPIIIQDHETETLEEIKDQKTKSPEEEIIQKEIREGVWPLLVEVLGERNASILFQYFYLGKSMKQIGLDEGLTESRVHQIISKEAGEHIKRSERLKDFKQFL